MKAIKILAALFAADPLPGTNKIFPPLIDEKGKVVCNNNVNGGKEHGNVKCEVRNFTNAERYNLSDNTGAKIKKKRTFRNKI